MRRKARPLVIFSIIMVLLVFVAQAEVPQLINYQGRLTDGLGNQVSDGEYQIIFNIWNWEQGGALLWSDTQMITVSDGLFAYQLGSDNPLPHSLFTDSTRYLGIKIGQDAEIYPRTKLTPSAYAYHSLRADTAVSVSYQAITNEMVMDTSIGFEKFAQNNAEIGDVIAYTGNKANGFYWAATGIAEVADQGWVDDGLVVRLHGGNDLVGIGTLNPQNKLDVSGAVAVGMNYSGIHTAPVDGMIIEGNVGIGSSAPGGHQLYVESSGSAVPGATAYIKNTAADGLGMMVESNSTDLALLVSQLSSGDIFRCDSYTGGWHPVFTIKNSGRAVCTELEITGGSDLAEPFEMSEGRTFQPGALVVIDDRNPGKLTLSGQPYDTRVAGIVSGAGGLNPGLTLTQRNIFENGQNVAIGGRVYCLADASYGVIKPGDMLTTSATPGHAMKAADRIRAYGAVVGKAMTSLESGKGLILVLVNLQ